MIENNTLIVCSDEKIVCSFSWEKILENSKIFIQYPLNPSIWELENICSLSVYDKYICCHPVIDDNIIAKLEICVSNYYSCKTNIVVDYKEDIYKVFINKSTQ